MSLENRPPTPSQDPLFTDVNQESINPNKSIKDHPIDMDAYVEEVRKFGERRAPENDYPPTTRYKFPDREEEARGEAEDWRLTPEEREAGRRGVAAARKILEESSEPEAK